MRSLLSPAAPRLGFVKPAVGLLVAALALMAPATASAVPSDRVYDLVTQPGEIPGLLPGPQVVRDWTDDGERILFGTFGIPMDPDDVTATTNAYGAKRTAAGWDQWPLTPALPGPQHGGDPDNVEMSGWSSDYETALVSSTRPLTPDAPPWNDVWRVYRTGLSTPTTLLSDIGDAPAVWGASPDVQEYLFSANKPLFDDDPLPAGPLRLYLFEDGKPGVISRDPDGNAFACGADIPFYGSPRMASEDWSRIFFQGDDCTSSRVYLYEGGSTAEIAPSECARPDCNGPQAVQFVTADPLGTKIVVRTAQQLTDDDVDSDDDLYLFELGGDLTRISAADGGTPGAALGVLAASRDLDVVYFASRGALTDDPDASAGQPNLYRWDGDLSHVTVLSEDDAQNWSDDRTSHLGDATPDGGRLAFSSTLQLTGDDSDAVSDVFVYDSGDGAIVRASVGEGGTGNVDVPATPPVSYARDGVRPAITADGARTFFVTDEALVPQDHNTVSDIYENNDGEISLITAGLSGVAITAWVGASSDGSTVFFVTSGSLLPSDGDYGAIDVYAARRGGGFPNTPARPAPCDGDGCQGGSTAGPIALAIGSVTFAAEDNSARVASVKVSGRRISGRAAVLRVRAPGKGSIVVSGRGVRKRQVRTTRAGTYRVRIALSRPGRRALARRGLFGTRLTVAFRPAQGARSQTRLTLRFKAGRNR
jgi:hypothetical protein